MNCPYYGKNGMFGKLLPQGGNECALIITSYSPCAMEMDGEEPEAARCPLAAGAQQIHDLVEEARVPCRT